ncbi:MAG: YeeE/YedE family protein [Gemmatimonadota bacterium]|nr:YeeE/YedE family protein [Gemmatimonadota bacterium]
MSQTMQRPAAAQQAPSPARVPDGAGLHGLLVYVLLGTFFGVVLVKSEVISWFRIQEMFRFHSFHLYGIMGSAVAVAALSLALIRRLGVRTRGGEEIVVPPKAWGRFGTRYWAGGMLFGVGWALTGACPGPLFALLGAGVGVMAFVIVAALAGAWAYGALRPRLPH